MRGRWREAWKTELPEVPRSRARALVVSLGLFWGCFALTAPSFRDADSAGPWLVPFFAGFASGWCFYLVLMRLWGTRLFVWPGTSGWRDEKQQQLAAMASLFRPAFIRRVFIATGWPPALVGLVLLSLLAADFFTF